MGPWFAAASYFAIVVLRKFSSSRLGNSGLKCDPRDSSRSSAPTVMTRAINSMFHSCRVNISAWLACLPVSSTEQVRQRSISFWMVSSTIFSSLLCRSTVT